MIIVDRYFFELGLNPKNVVLVKFITHYLKIN
jgi:hypothetical protein